MRTLRLAKVVAQTEGLRLREMAQRQVRRAIIGLAASVFLMGFLVAGHIAIAMALVPRFTPLEAVLIVGGGDLLIGLVLGAFAARSKPGAIERDALVLRRRAQQELHEAMTVPAILGQAARLVGVESLLKLVFSLVTGRAFRRKGG